jgi:S1-C subfamily serine protease
MGALVATWFAQANRLPSAVGQEFVPRGSGSSLREPSLGESRAAAVESPTVPSDADLAEFTPEERISIAVYERANRGVVNITTHASSPDAFFLIEVPEQGAGSGSVLDKEGHILTNYHVVENAHEIRVTLFNSESYEAGLVGRDPTSDIAVLRIDAPSESLYPIELGDSGNLRVGQRVFAIGNPFGLERTLTVGTLSSLNRRIPSRTGRDIKSVIQIDAAINPGSSGGPLLNSRGTLIGMNTAIASRTGQSAGVGFAIPVNTIRRIAPQLIENGRVIRPVIGIESVYETDQGLFIIKLVPGGPAERAGLRGMLVRRQERRGPFLYERTYIDRKNADAILAADGTPVRTGDELLDLIDAKKPGDRLILRVLRQGRELDVLLILGASE